MNLTVNAACAKRRLALSSSTAVLAMMMSAPAMAQGQETVETITSSSSRIMSSGFDAPTPTTVISAADLQAQARPNVFDSLKDLPALQGSTGA